MRSVLRTRENNTCACSQRTKKTPLNLREKKEEATNIDLPSTKVTNITSLSGVTRSGRIFAAPDPSVQPTDAKGKAKVVAEETNEASPTLDEDALIGRFVKKG